MNLHEALLSIWRERLAAVVLAIVAIVVAILFTFRISFSPPSLHPRALQLSVARTSVLIDARHSTLGSARANSHRYASLASTYTDLSNSEPIINPIAHALGVAPENIGVQTQVTQHVPLSQSQPLEPQVGTQILGTHHHYFLVARNDSGTQIVQFYGQAPTRAQALTIVRTAALALQDYVNHQIRVQHVAKSNRIEVRQLGLTYGGTLDKNVSLNAAILVAVIVWALGMIAVITLRNQARRARRRSEAEEPVEAPAERVEA
jgi:hypothetical protein